MNLIRMKNELVEALDGVTFGAPVAYVYNPLRYAGAAHEEYLGRYGGGGKDVIFLGMNPGPWGMTQTGVPFGEIAYVRDWLGISAPVGRPPRVHPSKPVEGFSCIRSEVSGLRLWGLVAETFGNPENFFRRFFVVNYCPLLFLDEGGRNLTPDKLKAADRSIVAVACDRALRDTVSALGAATVVGIGKYAENQARSALAGLEVEVASLLHPSPASPAANKGWKEKALAQLAGQGIRFSP